MAANALCKISGCYNPPRSRGMCNAHYLRWRKTGDADVRTPIKQRHDVCLVEECGGKPHARGYCSKHYQRWEKAGDPNGGNTPLGEPLAYLEDVVLSYRGADCLVWPYATRSDGYAGIKIDGRTRLVSRVVCERIHGQPPSEGLHAAHSCGRGQNGCVAPGHLRWATPAENCADKVIHGRTNRGERNAKAKLTEAQVRAMRKSMEPNSSLAALYEVSISTVRHARSGRSWGWLT